MLPVIDSLLWLPAAEVPPAVLDQASVVSPFDDEEGVVRAYEERDGLIGLPRSLGRTMLRPAEAVWNVAKGHPIEVPKCPVPWDKAQSEFFDGVKDLVLSKTDVLACAPTGTGKTVCACYTIYHAKVTTLVVVHLKRLAKQWVQQLVDKCGFDPSDVGFVGDGQKDWEGKKVVVALLQTLRRDSMPDAFWDYFGLAIPDEVHRTPAAKSSLVWRRLKSMRRLALTATPERADKLHMVYVLHVGEPKIRGRVEALACRVHVINYDNPVPERWVTDRRTGEPVCRVGWPTMYGIDPETGEEVDKMAARSAVMSILIKDQARTELCLRFIEGAFNRGRRGIVVAEKISHLEAVRDALVARGVPYEDTGLFTAERTDWADEVVWEEVEIPLEEWAKRFKVAERQGRISAMLADGKSVATVKRQVKDADGNVVRRRVKKRVKNDDEYLEEVKEDRRLVFATYGMLTEGIDQPQWDFGIDLVGRSTATQLIGRIRRKFPGKPVPLWATIRDRGCPPAENWFAGRFNDYCTSGNVRVTGL